MTFDFEPPNGFRIHDRIEHTWTDVDAGHRVGAPEATDDTRYWSSAMTDAELRALLENRERPEEDAV